MIREMVHTLMRVTHFRFNQMIREMVHTLMRVTHFRFSISLILY